MPNKGSIAKITMIIKKSSARLASKAAILFTYYYR